MEHSSSSSSSSNAMDSVGKCPVDFETRSLWSLWGNKQKKPINANGTIFQEQQQQASASVSSTTPSSLEEAARHAQTPHPGQRLALSTHRMESTIPRGSSNEINNNNENNHQSSTPGHQVRAPGNHQHGSSSSASTDAQWIYPSEQQVFNAMKRKGWKGIEEESIPSFLQIHNSVNERSWKEVQKWEETAGVPSELVTLSRFEGRPKDITPKAWVLSTLGICDKPFDRHDWYVVHKPKGGSSSTATTSSSSSSSSMIPERRYVLDFYMNGDDRRGGMPKVEIDVRPALDSPRAVFQRGQRLLKEMFPGIAREFDERMQKQK